ncbi:hypothetical protein J7T55_000270 [Diaporthe amygdali]|uniref:uncharacterized protein n=1 Tax=Phomopsis amygdali TaxID=1214568 RepID=UPI0022FE55BB|nr:uncharacterized protein J7T55_000270 [Diaporthe amygdali]KAJ0109345.1 hypothetical protein J7T55_000270 [Diaporthe amygdali]
MPSHNTNAQKGKAKAKETAPPAPKPDTSEVELQTLMRNAKVKVLIVEALGNAEFVAADPLKQEMGKKKNHWVLRFLIANPYVPNFRAPRDVLVLRGNPDETKSWQSILMAAAISLPNGFTFFIKLATLSGKHIKPIMLAKTSSQSKILRLFIISSATDIVLHVSTERPLPRLLSILDTFAN